MKRPYPVIELRPDRLADIVKVSPLLERVQEVVDGRALRRGQGQLGGLELLALEALDVQRRPLGACRLHVHHLV